MRSCVLLGAVALCLFGCSQASQPGDAALDGGSSDRPQTDGPRREAAAADGRSDAAALPHQAVVEALVKPIVDGQWDVGLVVALVTDAGTEVYGYGATGAGGARPDDRTIFEIGSISKTFTSLLLAIAVLEKSVTLDQPVQDLLPSARVTVPARNSKAILLRHLAAHTSGLPRMPSNFAPADNTNPYVDYTVDKLYAFLNGFELPVDPGTKWEYSNLGAGLLGHALSLKAATSYAELLGSKITGPLGLKDTVLQLSAEQTARFAQGHTNDLVATAHWDLDVLAPCGAIRSTARDLLQYLAAQAGRQTTTLAAAMTASHSPQFKLSASESIGLAWLIEDSRYLWHNGGTGGFATFAGFDAQTKNLVVVLGNTITYQQPETQLGLKLLRVLAGAVPTAIVLPPTLTLPTATLDLYCGTYQLQSAPAYKVTISRQGDGLYVTLPKQPTYRVWAQSTEKFYSRLAPFWVTFNKGTTGSYESLLFEQDGQPSNTYVRVP